MTLLSLKLFAHCAISSDDEVISGDVTSSCDNTIDIIEPTPQCQIDDGICDGSVDVIEALNEQTQSFDDHFIDNDLSVFSDDFSHDSHNTHSSSSCSGFILFDSDTDSPSFSTFDSDSGACNWGTDMSLNSENF